MAGFIDAHRDAHGVEPICTVLPVAPSTCDEHRAKRADPSRLPLWCWPSKLLSICNPPNCWGTALTPSPAPPPWRESDMGITRDFAPRLMPAQQAAHYLGVSESTLRTLDLPRRIVRAKRLYDRLDLDAFTDSLTSEGETGRSGVNSCDEIMRGIA